MEREQKEPAEEEEKKPQVIHPIRIRLKDTAAFCVTSPQALVGAGFASLGVGMFSIFRPTPLLLYSLVFNLKNHIDIFRRYRFVLAILCLAWMVFLLTVLFGFGLILLLSEKIKKRGVLLLHPWGLLLLYLDVLVWPSLTLWLHVEVATNCPTAQECWPTIYYPTLIFYVIYMDCIIFFLIYCAYATYFIVAELTLIERFF